MRDPLDELIGSLPDAAASDAPRPLADATAETTWQSFAPETGTLGIPRASMPQIKSEHRGAMVQFLKGRGITHEQTEIAPSSLKPSQAEYSPEKVERARTYDGPQRSILVSSDDHVLDGHHEWLKGLEDEPDTPIPAIRLHAPAHQLLIEAARFPSSGVDDTSGGQKQAAPPRDDLDELLRTLPDATRADGAALPSHSARARKAAPAATSSFVLERDAPAIKEAFRAQFGRELPVSAYGQTEFHRSLGRDHSADMDVAVDPSSAEGRWLTDYLSSRGLPFIPQYHAGNLSTGPHVHVGTESRRRDALDDVLDTLPAAGDAPSSSPDASAPAAPAGDELDQLLAGVPSADESLGVVGARMPDDDAPSDKDLIETWAAKTGGSDEARQVASLFLMANGRRTMIEQMREWGYLPAARPSAVQKSPAAPQTFDPYTSEGRAQRDAQAAAESQPGAVAHVAVPLPLEYSKLTNRDVAEMAARQVAKAHGYGEDRASAVLAAHPEIGLYDLKDEQGRPVENFYESASFDPKTRTMRVGSPARLLQLLKEEDDARSNALGRGVSWALDDRRTAGEKAGDVASAGAHAADVVTRPLQALSTVVAGEQRNAGALLAAPFSKSARDVLASGLYDPNTQIAAALHKLKTGETPAGYEQPVAEGLDLLSQLYRREPLHPLVKEAVALGFDPVTYAPLEAVGEAGGAAVSKLARGAGRVVEDLPGAGRVRQAARALTDAPDARAEEVFNSGGRVLDLNPAEKLGAPPVPETPETLEAQIAAMREGRRAVVHVTPGERAVVPRGMRSFGTPEGGRIIYNPELVERAEVVRRMDDGSLGDLMGHVEPKPDAPSHVVVARDPATGAELQSSYVSSAEAADAQAAAFREQFPGAEVEIGGGELESRVLGERAAGGPSRARRVADGVLDVAALPRSVMTAADLSAPGRQGLIFTLTEPTAGLRAMGRQLRSFASEGGEQKMIQWLATHPDADLAEASGLYSALKQGGSLAGREEAFMSRVAGHVPLVKRSERAYVAYLDSLRQDVFSKYARELERAGLSFETDPTAFKDVARFVNSATGRGELPEALEKFAPAMNATLFAPRNLKGRLDLINPLFYKNLSPAARRIAARKMIQFAGTVTGGMYLAKLAGAKVTLDPDDPDFGKVTVGKTHYDFTGGLRGPVRLVAQLGKTFATERGNPVPKAAQKLALYLREQTAPPVNYAWAAATGKELNREPFEWWGHLHRAGKFAPGGGVIDRTLYLSAQDLFDAWAEDGGKGVAKAAPAALLGVGVQTYEPKPRRGYSGGGTRIRPRVHAPSY